MCLWLTQKICKSITKNMPRYPLPPNKTNDQKNCRCPTQSSNYFWWKGEGWDRIQSATPSKKHECRRISQRRYNEARQHGKSSGPKDCARRRCSSKRNKPMLAFISNAFANPTGQKGMVRSGRVEKYGKKGDNSPKVSEPDFLQKIEEQLLKFIKKGTGEVWKRIGEHD